MTTPVRVIVIIFNLTRLKVGLESSRQNGTKENRADRAERGLAQVSLDQFSFLQCWRELAGPQRDPLPRACPSPSVCDGLNLLGAHRHSGRFSVTQRPVGAHSPSANANPVCHVRGGANDLMVNVLIVCRDFFVQDTTNEMTRNFLWACEMHL